MRTVRAAGFDPLAPPLREGTTYVLRATDFRGILMRVVVDARSGAIRDANRIVPGPGSYGQAEFGPYGAPASFSASAYGEPAPPSPNDPDLARLPAGRAAAHPRVVISPPLPRPRPAALAKTDSKAELKPAEAAAPAASSKPAPIND
jgi:hypothetical protein